MEADTLLDTLGGACEKYTLVKSFATVFLGIFALGL